MTKTTTKQYALRWVETNPNYYRPSGGYMTHNNGLLALYVSPKRAHMAARTNRQDRMGYWEIVECELTPIRVIPNEEAKKG